MKDLYAAVSFCEEVLDSLNIPYSDNIIYTINTRSKTRWGQCSKRGSAYKIEVNKALLLDGNEDFALESVLLHEMIHSCPECMNHGAKWQKYCDMVNKAYGYNIKRTANEEEYNMHEGQEYFTTVRVVRHILICKDCGKEYTYQRESKAVKYYKTYRCSLCNGELDRKDVI